MNPKTRKLFVQSFEDRLLTEFTPPGEERKVTYREFLFQQAVQLRQLASGHIDQYTPLRIVA